MHTLDALCASLKQEFDSLRKSEAQSSRAALGSELNEFVRRLRRYQGESEWAAIVLDGASLFSDRSALFLQAGNALSIAGSRGLELAPDLTFREPLPRALDAVLHSQDAIVALRTPGEVGDALASAASDRALLLPILNEDRVVAVLAALGAGDAAMPALELIAVLAGTVLERRANSKQTLAIQPTPAASHSAPPTVKTAALPPWSRLPDGARALHLRAQRFARVRVAEMQLAHSDAARAGREQANLYLFLKEPLDAARQSYQTQFMQPQQVREACMVDYLHLELIRTMAEGDESRLGDEYPGPLQ